MKKTKPSKSEVNRHIKERANKAQVNIITLRVIELLGKNYVARDIKAILSKEYGKSELQITKYLTKAYKRLKEDFHREADLRRIEMEESLRSDLKTAYVEYELAETPRDRNNWFKTIGDIKDRIYRFTPEVQPDDTQTINITFGKVDKGE